VAGTTIGGRKAAIKNRQYNKDFYTIIGRKGGKISRGGGFSGNSEAARIAGRKGGAISKRRKAEV